MRGFWRPILSLSRTLHIYLTALGLVILTFFAATGFMLNHSAWFGLDDVRTTTAKATLPPGMLAGPDKLAIVEKLRAELGAVGPLESCDADEREVRVVFRMPGSRAEAVIARDTGQAEITLERRGLAGALTDLHKAGSKGTRWGLVIDATAVLLLIALVSGVILWLSLPSRRAIGIAAIVLSAAACALAYWMSYR